MNKVISFSLWGDNPKYTIGAVKNAFLAKYIYTGWECRFYVANDVPQAIIDGLIQNSAKVINMGEGKISSMLWRFKPLYDPDVDVFISRDTDSRLSYRERVAVDEWLLSGKKLHIMRDHAYHQRYVMGGMWGYNGTIENDTIDAFLASKENPDYYDVDQEFLSELFSFETSVLVHDEMYQGETFPSPRQNNEYVGAPYDHLDNLEIQFIEVPHFPGVV